MEAAPSTDRNAPWDSSTWLESSVEPRKTTKVYRRLHSDRVNNSISRFHFHEILPVPVSNDIPAPGISYRLMDWSFSIQLDLSLWTVRKV